MMTFWIEIDVEDDSVDDVDEYGEYAMETISRIKMLSANRYHKADIYLGSKWERYLAYLHDWAWCHNADSFKGMSPASFEEWAENEGKATNENTFDVYGRI